MFRGELKAYISIVLISLISTAAAMWSDSLKISTTIKTGDPDVDFDGIDTDDPPGSKDPGTIKTWSRAQLRKMRWRTKRKSSKARQAITTSTW